MCPVLPSLSPEKPSVFSQELTDAIIMEGEDLTLVCETTVPDNPVHWTKDGKTLRESARCQLSREGRRAQLVITGTTLQDGGRYKCEAAGAWSSSIVRIHGEPSGRKDQAASSHALCPRLSSCSGQGRPQTSPSSFPLCLCPLGVCVAGGRDYVSSGSVSPQLIPPHCFSPSLGLGLCC